MALVDYTSSDDDEAETALECLPPLPAKFHDLYASATRVSTRDDPSLHGGRKRTAPHVEGNWPTHIYIEWFPSPTEYDFLDRLISSVRERALVKDASHEIHSFLTSDLGVPLSLHISLSRPIAFTTAQKDEFIESLQHATDVTAVRPFAVSFNALEWVSNLDESRWFLILRTSKPKSDGLNKLLHVCNLTVQQCGQTYLYTDSLATVNAISRAERHVAGHKPHQISSAPSSSSSSRTSSRLMWLGLRDVSDAFHVSIAWSLRCPSQSLLAMTQSISTEQLPSMHQISVQVADIKVKIGNVVTNIPLTNYLQEGQSLFGE